MRIMIERGLTRWIAGVIWLAALTSCSKGATSIDGDANRAEDLSNDEQGEPDPICGNGVIDDDMGEDCDGNAFGGRTCENLGFAGGILSCDPNMCTFDVSMCTRPNTPGGGAGG
jgi:hypothetical protein